MTDTHIIKLTAAEIAQKIASGESHRRRGRRGAPRAHRRRRREGQRLPARRPRRRPRAGPRRRREARARRGARPARGRAARPEATSSPLQDMPTTVGSKILEGWRPPYDATLVRKLRAADVVILGKTNMDEFAMGSSTENSAYGPTGNPWDLSRIPGGSGGGSSAALAAYEAPLAIGTDLRAAPSASGRRHRHRRRQADLRRGVPLRHGGLLLLPRPGRAVRPHRPRRGPAARGHRRARPDGLDLHRRARPAGRRGRPQRQRRGHARRCRQAVPRRGLPGRQVVQRFDESVALLKELGAQIVELDCPSLSTSRCPRTT